MGVLGLIPWMRDGHSATRSPYPDKFNVVVDRMLLATGKDKINVALDVSPTMYQCSSRNAESILGVPNEDRVYGVPAVLDELLAMTRMYLRHRCRVFAVFDGDSNFGPKSKTHAARRQRGDASKERWASLHENDTSKRGDILSKAGACAKPTIDIKAAYIEAVKDMEDVVVIQAVMEADPEVAGLVNQGICDIAATVDSDMLPYMCEQFLLKINVKKVDCLHLSLVNMMSSGYEPYVWGEKHKQMAEKGNNMHGWSRADIVFFCCLNKNDFCSVSNIGIKRGYECTKATLGQGLEERLEYLENMNVSESDMRDFRIGWNVFHHAPRFEYTRNDDASAVPRYEDFKGSGNNLRVKLVPHTPTKLDWEELFGAEVQAQLTLYLRKPPAWWREYIRGEKTPYPFRDMNSFVLPTRPVKICKEFGLSHSTCQYLCSDEAHDDCTTTAYPLGPTPHGAFIDFKTRALDRIPICELERYLECRSIWTRTNSDQRADNVLKIAKENMDLPLRCFTYTDPSLVPQQTYGCPPSFTVDVDAEVLKDPDDVMNAMKELPTFSLDYLKRHFPMYPGVHLRAWRLLDGGHYNLPRFEMRRGCLSDGAAAMEFSSTCVPSVKSAKESYMVNVVFRADDGTYCPEPNSFCTCPNGNGPCSHKVPPSRPSCVCISIRLSHSLSHHPPFLVPPPPSPHYIPPSLTLLPTFISTLVICPPSISPSLSLPFSFQGRTSGFHRTLLQAVRDAPGFRRDAPPALLA